MAPRLLLAACAVLAGSLVMVTHDWMPRSGEHAPGPGGEAIPVATLPVTTLPGTNAGTAIGIEIEAPAPVLDPAAPLRTPSGRQILPGTVDVNGYVLPLDVRRPRPGRQRPARPSAAMIDAARRAAHERRGDRGAAPGMNVTEIRLGPDDGHTQNETTIDADGDVIVVGWNNFTETGLDMGFASSTDGGQSFVEGLLGGHSLTSDPAVKSGGNGNWYYGYLASPGSGGSDIDIYVRRSTDSGQSWGAPVAASHNGSFDDKPYIDARGDEVLVAWADFGFSPAKVSVSRSTDAGQSFGPATVLAQNSVGGNGACPVIDADGDYYVFWRDSFQESLWVAVSTDQGASWSADRGIVDMHPLPSPQPGGYRMVNLPSADADPVTGTLLVVWNDQRFGDPDILAVRSTDGGATWSLPIRVNDDAGTATQFFPWVDFDPDGGAHVVWYDRRANGFDIDVYVASSTDGGQSFGPGMRVTAQPFTPVLPWEGGASSFIGDYNGIAATSDRVYPFYQDSREGNQDVWLAFVPQSTTGIADGGVPAMPDRPRIVASPTPFRGSTRLLVAGGASGTRLDIVGVDGRLVRRLELDAGGEARWDGRDAAGRPSPAGVYLARLAADDGGAARRERAERPDVSGIVRLVKLD